MLCPRQHHRHLLLSSDFSAPTPVTDIRTDKVEQKSVSLSWQEPGFPTANGTEYEVKYYEKVGSGHWLWLSVVLQPAPADSWPFPSPARPAPRERGMLRVPVLLVAVHRPPHED